MMDAIRLKEIIALGEAIDREFKSDRRKISDAEIHEEVVAMANADGGVLLIGIENDGTISGAQPRHEETTDPIRLQSAIFNNTSPNINTRISVPEVQGRKVIAIEVDIYPEICATAQGKVIRRIIGPDGKPATVPFLPRDQRSRRVDLGLIDFSAQLMEGASFESFDPLEFERLRQTITRLRGDQSLKDLSDEEIAKALQLVETQGDRLLPNVAGLLLLGREEIVRKLLPTHEVHFQVLDAQGDVKVNDAFQRPLLHVLSEVESRFAARNEEREVMVGMFRVPIPDYSPIGFREALSNALLHRDYTRLDAVYVQWQPDHLLITSPGGFPVGITAENLLVHEPKPKNPRLAAACKRIGLVEQTGRGVDKIYMGQLRYGRPVPDYTRSDSTGVRVIIRGGKPSLDFSAFVFEQEDQGKKLELDDLLILNALFHERRIDVKSACTLIQKGTTETKSALERLLERGLVEPRGERQARTYHLSGMVYKRLNMEAEYIRAKGFEPHQHEQMVLDYVRKMGRITRSEAADMCHLSGDQASRLLRRISIKYEHFRMVGTRKGAYYIWADPGG